MAMKENLAKGPAQLPVSLVENSNKLFSAVSHQ
jgi:hypothetical protein